MSTLEQSPAFGVDSSRIEPRRGTTTIVYIAGYGRSGSTLLDLLLGRQDGWFSMGEFRLFWHAVRDGWKCGCGLEVSACPVWAKVLSDAAADDVSGILADFRTVVRMRRIPGLVDQHLLGPTRAARDRLARVVGRTYAATATRTGARVLVDSSKDPIYGLLLNGAPDVALHVVHLVRDPRAVAWSWQRSRRRPEIAGRDAFMPLRSPIQTSLEWDAKNAIARLLGTRTAGYTRVSYESLVADPAAVVAGIAQAISGTDVPPITDLGLDAILPNHTVAGNPMRFGTHLDVRPDAEWRDAIAPIDRRRVTALTWPLLRAYGYSTNAGRRPVSAP